MASDSKTEKKLLFDLGLWELSGLSACVAFIAWYLFGVTVYFSGFHSIASICIGTWFGELQPLPEKSLVLPLMFYMLWHVGKKEKGLPHRGSLHGLWLIVLGALIALTAVRTIQFRLGILMLSPLLAGLTWYYWGTRTMLRCLFPYCYLLILVIPPGLEQATVWMQLLATKAAHWGAALFGVDTVVEGTNIISVSGKWDAFNIAGGCSGMNSLITLLMLALPWAFLADSLTWWKRCLFVLSTIPLAIIANAFRVSSIFILAEYIDSSFAAKTWHDWSGLVLFFPACLVGLFTIHGLLMGEIPFLKRRKVIIHRQHDGKEAA